MTWITPHFPRNVLLPVGLALATSLLLTLSACDVDDDDDYYYHEPGLSTTVAFVNECAVEPVIDVYVDGVYRCSVSNQMPQGCKFDVDPGQHVYWAEGEALLWGEPRSPLPFFAEFGTLEVVRLRCD